MAETQDKNRVYIFDTTLRDGEQSPGCSMNVPEKLRMAHKLAELGVDILEAGFPIASEGDFEAVRSVANELPWVRVAALARSCFEANLSNASDPSISRISAARSISRPPASK